MQRTEDASLWRSYECRLRICEVPPHGRVINARFKGPERGRGTVKMAKMKVDPTMCMKTKHKD
jgi:hypothetical protein